MVEVVYERLVHEADVLGLNSGVLCPCNGKLGEARQQSLDS